MATRKQKHAAALARREQFMEEIRREGLAAQKQGKIDTAEAALERWAEPHKNLHFKFVDNCPHCQIIMSASSTKAQAS